MPDHSLSDISLGPSGKVQFAVQNWLPDQQQQKLVSWQQLGTCDLLEDVFWGKVTVLRNNMSYLYTKQEFYGETVVFICIIIVYLNYCVIWAKYALCALHYEGK